MSYLWIGYGLTWIALALYAWRLEARREAAARRQGGGGPASGPEAGEAEEGAPVADGARG